MKTIVVFAIVSVLALFTPRADASPVVVYNNFGPGETYDTSNAWVVAGPDTFTGQSALAESFTPASTVTFDAVLLPLGYFSGTNSVIVSLTPDAAGQPAATPLESFTLTNLASFFSNGAVYQLNSALDPTLNAGTTYWITAFPGASNTIADWFFNTTAADQYSSSGNGGATWQSNLFNPSPAMEVLGNPVPTPEPTSLSLLTGLAVCAIGMRYRRFRAA